MAKISMKVIKLCKWQRVGSVCIDSLDFIAGLLTFDVGGDQISRGCIRRNYMSQQKKPRGLAEVLT